MIDFTAKLFDMNSKGAAVKLAADFGIPYDVNGSRTARVRAAPVRPRGCPQHSRPDRMRTDASGSTAIIFICWRTGKRSTDPERQRKNRTGALSKPVRDWIASDMCWMTSCSSALRKNAPNLLKRTERRSSGLNRGSQNQPPTALPPALETVTMTELFDTAFPPREPVIDGLLYSGTYLFVGAPKIGKSFLWRNSPFMWQQDCRCGTTMPGRALSCIWRWRTTTPGCKAVCPRYLAWRAPTISTSPSGLLGAADGAFVLQKKKRTDNTATMAVVGRDQEGLESSLRFDRERCLWELVRQEIEPTKEPVDEVVSKVAALMEKRDWWGGTATELLEQIPELKIKPNALTRRLNVKMSELYNDYGIIYRQRPRTGTERGFTLLHRFVDPDDRPEE